MSRHLFRELTITCVTLLIENPVLKAGSKQNARKHHKKTFLVAYLHRNSENPAPTQSFAYQQSFVLAK